MIKGVKGIKPCFCPMPSQTIALQMVMQEWQTGKPSQIGLPAS